MQICHVALLLVTVTCSTSLIQLLTVLSQASWIKTDSRHYHLGHSELRTLQVLTALLSRTEFMNIITCNLPDQLHSRSRGNIWQLKSKMVLKYLQLNQLMSDTNLQQLQTEMH